MRSRDNETLIVVVGVAVLAVSLLLPLARKVAEQHDIRQVATKAIEVKDKLFSSDTAQPLRARVTNLVDGLSPDAALADAALHDDQESSADGAPVLVPGEPADESADRDSDPEAAGVGEERRLPIHHSAAQAVELHQTKRQQATSVWAQ